MRGSHIDLAGGALRAEAYVVRFTHHVVRLVHISGLKQKGPPTIRKTLHARRFWTITGLRYLRLAYTGDSAADRPQRNLESVVKDGQACAGNR
jgi:hypothetical protein